MPRPRHRIAFDLRECFLSAGRVALVCYLFLIPFRSADSAGDLTWIQHEACSQLTLLGPVEQASSRCLELRHGFGGALPFEPGAFVVPTLVHSPVTQERLSGRFFLSPSLVELQVRLQV